MSKEHLEQTLVLIKPDALKNSLTGYLLVQLSEFHTGLYFAGVKIVNVSKMLAEEHYTDHRGKPFFPPLVEYIRGLAHYPDEPQRQRVIALVYQGPKAVKKIREIAGPTDPHIARSMHPGTIRALGTIVLLEENGNLTDNKRIDNLVHASCSENEAEREIKLWFKPNDIPPSMHAYPTQQSQEHYYFKDNRLYHKHVPESVCLIAPGELVWKSDLESLQKIFQGQASPVSLESVAAKYLINSGLADI